MSKKETITGAAEAWESGKLGRDKKHAKKAAPELQKEIEDALGLQMISIRLPAELINEFKIIAKFNGVGYQPLMRDALARFADAELKKMAIEYANVREQAARENAEPAPVLAA
jgi:predicted DNA binding CopG/RHH family protein